VTATSSSFDVEILVPPVENFTWIKGGTGTYSSTPNSITKTSGNGWNLNVRSEYPILESGDGYIEWTYVSGERGYFAGIQSSAVSNGVLQSNIDFGIYIFGSETSVRASEDAVQIGPVWPQIFNGDVFKIAIESGVVKYYLNDALQYTSLVAPTYPLYFGTHIFSNGQGPTEIAASDYIAPALTWNAGSNGTWALTPTSFERLDTYASTYVYIQSVEEIASGDFFLEFKGNAVSIDSQIGIDFTPHAPLADNPASFIDFGFRHAGGGNYTFWESINIGGGQAFIASDVFKIEVVGTTITYYVNNIQVREVTGASVTYPAKLTAATFSQNMKISDITFGSL
jgi:hypothetical protein